MSKNYLETLVIGLMIIVIIVACLVIGNDIYLDKHSEIIVSEFQIVDKNRYQHPMPTGASFTTYELTVDVNGTFYNCNVERDAYDSLEVGSYTLFNVYKMDNADDIHKLQLYEGTVEKINSNL